MHMTTNRCCSTAHARVMVWLIVYYYTTIMDFDLPTVLEETFRVRTKWHDMGIMLRVSEDELESIESRCPEPRDCHREMIKCWLKQVNPRPTWVALIKALKSEVVGESALAKELEEKCFPVQSVSKETAYFQSLLTKLKEKLKLLQSAQSTGKIEVSQEFTYDYISTSLRSGASIEHIEEQLQILFKTDLLLSEELYQQAYEYAHRVNNELHPALREEPVSESTPAKPEPLFNKDTVYHAGVCSLAVNTCDAGNYQQFFKKKDKVPGHSFTEVSLSRSKQDRYIIARQGDSSHSTLYFGFQSEPQLLEWSKQFKSFSEGVAAQSKKFPIRLIVELLNKQQRIVLTGFSFGGLLACAVAACVWNTPYIPTNLLKQNLVCITFGQPHMANPILEEVARQRPELVSTIHSFYCEDDPVPRLLKFLDKSWSQEDMLKERAPFQDPITSDLLNKIDKLQRLCTEDQDSLSETVLVAVKSKLKTIVLRLDPNGTAKPPCATLHLISTVPDVGLSCTTLNQEQATLQSDYLQQTDIECLNVASFKQHSSVEYTQRKLFCGYLEKDPMYEFPTPKCAPREVADVKLSVQAVKIRHHGDEIAVVVEGENFWFCYRMKVGGHSTLIPAQDMITGSSIQFSISVQDKANVAAKEGKIRVSLQSHFSKNPIKHDVEVDEKRYDISTRQQQLARLTPSQVIELAFLCALLEQHPYSRSELLSHKLDVIRPFLEMVVHIVPLESVVFAIGCGNETVHEMCSEALVASRDWLVIPPSQLLRDGARYVREQLRLGVPISVLREIERRAKKRFPGELPIFYSSSYHCDQDHIYYSLCSRQPGTNIPISPPFHTEVMKVSEIDMSSIGMRNKAALDYIEELYQKSADDYDISILQLRSPTMILCGLNIDKLYPINSLQQQNLTLKSPIDVLASGRSKLSDLREVSSALPLKIDCETRKGNQQMLKTVNDFRMREVATCTTLLGAFMEQEEINISLVKSRTDSSEVLGISAAASVGVWALFSLDYSQVQPILAKCKGEQLSLKIEDYIRATLSSNAVPEDSQYAAKLQFVVQGMTKTVTCNSQYISYSLEQQLTEICKQRKIDTSTTVDTLLMKWSKLFKENTLSLVHWGFRPLIARWMIWALMMHNLREELAKYIAVGVVGLVNSGKSKLVNTLFSIKIPVGTAEAKRTTVPFLYNLDEHVEGLDVVDFPGVDDEDDTIPDLADLLVTIAQIVIFVVDYRKVHTQSAKKWLERLQTEKVPVLVCLTFADKFYAEHMTEDGQHPKKEIMKRQLKDQLAETEKKLDSSHLHKVQFFSFSQDRDSVLNSDEGRQKLKDVGIGSPRDVGEWLVEVFQRDFGQETLALKLESFIHNPPQDWNHV